MTCVIRFVLFTLLCITAASADEKIKVLIIDGQNNHNWKQTTPVMKTAFEDGGIFAVDVATSPAQGQDMRGFTPTFSNYDVIVSNYNGDRWCKPAEKAFVDYISGGGGFVCVHAADNAFGDWPEYNEIIGLGGWGGRNEKSGPYVYYNQSGAVVRDLTKGNGGNHGPQHPFEVIIRDSSHPITRNMPRVWIHTKDELYDRLRGPASHMRILATAFASQQQGGRDQHEPMMMVLDYGKGRVFHTPMGHADYSMQCVGFITTLLRGTEWAATGEVTQDIPEDFPTRSETASRQIGG